MPYTRLEGVEKMVVNCCACPEQRRNTHLQLLERNLQVETGLEMSFLEYDKGEGMSKFQEPFVEKGQRPS